jgi:hypothetical protein
MNELTISHKRSSWIILLYIILGLPFIGHLFLGSGLLLLTKVCLVLFLFINTRFTKQYHLAALVIFFLIFLVQVALNTSKLPYLTFLLLDVVFFVGVWRFLDCSSVNRGIILSFLYRAFFVISILIIASQAIFIVYPSLFSEIMIGEYPEYNNPILGSITPDKNRPHWYFAEPSYAGFCIGAVFFLCIDLFSYNKKKKLLYLTFLFVAILCIRSYGTWLYFFWTMSAFLLFRVIKNPKMRIVLVFFFIALAFFITIAHLDSIFDIMDTENLGSVSFGSRQERIENGFKIINGMGLGDWLIGKGAEYQATLLGEGQSNAYILMLVDYGFIFLIAYILFIVKKLYKAPLLLLFLLLEFNTVILTLSPFTLLIIILGSYRDKVTVHSSLE